MLLQINSFLLHSNYLTVEIFYVLWLNKINIVTKVLRSLIIVLIVYKC